LPATEWRPNDTALQILEILKDGRWHRLMDLVETVGDRNRFKSSMVDCPLVAESDSGRYWCIPDEHTPTLAPDERETDPI